jgi:hypothetical protein
MPEFNEEKIRFWSHGVKCSGLLYTPRKKDNKLPAIVMANGFGAVKEMYLPEYAKRWAEEGFVVLAFDYRYFGESEGEPRCRLFPEEQLADYRCAIHYIKSLDYVDKDRIGIWGTSFSGGHVVTLLAFPPPGVKCGVAQVPNVVTYKVAISYFGTLDILMELADIAREGTCKNTPETMPIVAKEGLSALRTEEAYEFYTQAEKLFPTFRNMVTLDSVERVLQYYPAAYAEIVSRPIKIIVAEMDTTTPPELVEEMYRKIPAEKEFKTLPAGHFDLYFSPHLERAADEALAWFKKYLGG